MRQYFIKKIKIEILKIWNLTDVVVYIFAYTELSRYYFVFTGTVNLMLSGRSEQII